MLGTILARLRSLRFNQKAPLFVFADDITGLWIRAKECGMPPEVADSHVRIKMFECLPRNIALHLKEQEDQSTENLLKALNKRAKIERELTRERGGKLRTEGNASTSRTKCLLCSGTNHRTYHCRRGTPEERRTAALKAGLCLKCLQRGHKSKECPGKGTCTGCKGDHHQTICGKGRRINAMSELPSEEDDDVPIKEMGLYDTGASISAISRKKLEQLGVRYNRKRCKVQLADGSKTDCLGRITLEITIGDTTRPATLYVFDRLQRDIIVGTDLIQEFRLEQKQGLAVYQGHTLISNATRRNKTVHNVQESGEKSVAELIRRYKELFQGRGRTRRLEHEIRITSNKEFQIENIDHIKGADNDIADTLSRIQINLLEEAESEDNEEDETIRKDRANFVKKGNKWFFQDKEGDKTTLRAYIKKADERKYILQEVHNNGHFGLFKTQEEIRKRFWWPNWKKDVVKALKNCESCQKFKENTETTRLPLVPSAIETNNWSRVGLDICGPLQKFVFSKNPHKLLLFYIISSSDNNSFE
ncbi:UNVERIFIED_CONTAM: hypothetical protein PYX00_009257 [Menopon gallinae]|uniref:RNA-directed DNA polymerase n=1 Tax=Menopon gallinae TaxID=328185 RepID=A0AAW2HAW1_9NEOP